MFLIFQAHWLFPPSPEVMCETMQIICVLVSPTQVSACQSLGSQANNYSVNMFNEYIIC